MRPRATRGLSATFVALIAGASNAGGLLGNVLVGQIGQHADYFDIAFGTGAGILALGAFATPFLGVAASLPPPAAKPDQIAVTTLNPAESALAALNGVGEWGAKERK